MKKLLMLGIVPLFASVMLQAQADPPNATTTNYNETMMNSGCFFHRNQQNNIKNGYLSVSVVTNTNCPVKQTHSEIGVVAPNGRFVPLAPVANTHMITWGSTKHHHRRDETIIAQNRPVNVRVFATPNGSVVVRPIH